MTLLEEAKKKSTRKRSTLEITAEHMELAEGYLKGEVTLMAVAKVLDKTEINSAYLLVTRALKQSYIEGRIKVK